jgi:hypothetical protein
VTYFLYTTKEPGHGDVLLWWRKGGAGYSRYLEEAGTFTREQADHYVNGSGYEVVAVEAPEAYALAKRVVRIDDVKGAWAKIRETRSRET